MRIQRNSVLVEIPLESDPLEHLKLTLGGLNLVDRGTSINDEALAFTCKGFLVPFQPVQGLFGDDDQLGF